MNYMPLSSKLKSSRLLSKKSSPTRSSTARNHITCLKVTSLSNLFLSKPPTLILHSSHNSFSKLKTEKLAPTQPTPSSMVLPEFIKEKQEDHIISDKTLTTHQHPAPSLLISPKSSKNLLFFSPKKEAKHSGTLSFSNQPNKKAIIKSSQNSKLEYKMKIQKIVFKNSSSPIKNSLHRNLPSQASKKNILHRNTMSTISNEFKNLRSQAELSSVHFKINHPFLN